MSQFDEDVRELKARISEVLAARIEERATNRFDLTEQSIASIANHYTALKAVEWFMKEHSIQ